jgi:hypothetical protein
VLVSYVPDEQDELIGDAEAVGGQAFAEQLQYRASAETDALCQWDGRGKEPVFRRVMWLEAAHRLVDERRRQMGLLGSNSDRHKVVSRFPERAEASRHSPQKSGD